MAASSSLYKISMQEILADSNFMQGCFSGVARNIWVLRQPAKRTAKILLINIHNYVILRKAARKMVVPCVAGGSIAMIAD